MVIDTGSRQCLIDIPSVQEEDPIILESTAWIDYLGLKSQYWVRVLLNLTVPRGL